MNKKVVTWGMSILLTIQTVLAVDLPSKAVYNNLFGSLGSIGYYFSTIINYLIYGAYWISYWLLIILFFLLVAFLVFWLPLRLYPTFIQYYNFFQRVFKLT